MKSMAAYTSGNFLNCFILSPCLSEELIAPTFIPELGILEKAFVLVELILSDVSFRKAEIQHLRQSHNPVHGDVIVVETLDGHGVFVKKYRGCMISYPPLFTLVENAAGRGAGKIDEFFNHQNTTI